MRCLIFLLANLFLLSCTGPSHRSTSEPPTNRWEYHSQFDDFTDELLSAFAAAWSDDGSTGVRVECDPEMNALTVTFQYGGWSGLPNEGPADVRWRIGREPAHEETWDFNFYGASKVLDPSDPPLAGLLAPPESADRIIFEVGSDASTSRRGFAPLASSDRAVRRVVEACENALG